MQRRPHLHFATLSQLLSAFSDILRVVAAALGRMVDGSDAFHPVIYCLERLAAEFRDKFGKFNSAAPGRRAGY